MVVMRGQPELDRFCSAWPRCFCDSPADFAAAVFGHVLRVDLLLLAAFWTMTRDRAWLIVPIAGVLLILAFLGINRGEIVRLWIFLGVLMQLAAAQACAGHPRLFRAALAASIVQTAVLMPAVGWITLG